jgi:hypothetical protein
MSSSLKYPYDNPEILNMVPRFESKLPIGEQDPTYQVRLKMANLLLSFYYFLYDEEISISESTYVLNDGKGHRIPQKRIENEEERIKEMEDINWMFEKLTDDKDELESQIRYVLKYQPRKLDILKKILNDSIMFDRPEQIQAMVRIFSSRKEVDRFNIYDFIIHFNALRPDLVSIVEIMDRELKTKIPNKIFSSYYQKYIKYKTKYLALKKKSNLQ